MNYQGYFPAVVSFLLQVSESWKTSIHASIIIEKMWILHYI